MPNREPIRQHSPTPVGGLLDGKFLHDAPLEAQRIDAEQLPYVLYNESQGVHISRDDGHEQVASDDIYRTLVAVTDVRVLSVIGRDEGDLTYSVPLVDVGVDDGLVSGSLWLATGDGRCEFLCRGELEPVATIIDGNAKATVRAYRLFDEARDSIETATEHRSDGQLRRRSTLSRRPSSGSERPATDWTRSVPVHWRRSTKTAPKRGGESVTVPERYTAPTLAAPTPGHGRTGPRGSTNRLTTGTRRRSPRTGRRCGRQVTAPPTPNSRTSETGPRPNGTNFGGTPGGRPAGRLRGGLHRRPAPAAERWETAIRRYQDVLWLDWGHDERRFDGEPEYVRESVVDAVDNLLTDRRAAARACREAAHAHRSNDANDAARGASRVALAHLDRARSVVGEVAPNRATGPDDTRAAVEQR